MILPALMVPPRRSMSMVLASTRARSSESGVTFDAPKIISSSASESLGVLPRTTKNMLQFYHV